MSTGFFDMHEKLNAPPGRRVPSTSTAPSPSNDGPPRALTVSQLTAEIDRVIRAGFPSVVWVKGEVSNFNRHRGSGHLYFTLKDTNACIDCVMFKTEAARVKFAPTDGLELICSGRVQVYATKGRHQLYVSTMQPLGKGALELAFQQLRAKLEAEGFFNAERKKPLPRYPTRVALVTSRDGAAVQDMLKVLRRFAWLKIYLYHVPVQGDGSAERICDAITLLNARGKGDLDSAIDVILLARGGGSLEDLWEFNEECLARAIFASRIPIVTGIGHEVDTSIADLVADHHAHTPTEAAQVVTTHWRAIKELVDAAGARMRRGLRTIVQEARHRLRDVERHETFRRPLDRINLMRQQLDERQRSLGRAATERLRRASTQLSRVVAGLQESHPRHAVRLHWERLLRLEVSFGKTIRESQRVRRAHLEQLAVHLSAIGPEQVLRRGYTITTVKKTGQVVRSAAQLKGGERIVTRLADGKIESIAEDPVQLPLFE